MEEIKERIGVSLRFIDDHLDTNLTIHEIAKNAGYSDFYFSRIFKSVMNTTIYDYVIKRKLLKASQLILKGEKIIDVAMAYGWQSHAGFTKAFQKEFHISPSLLQMMCASYNEIGGNTMSHVFLQATDVGATKEELILILKDLIAKSGIEWEELSFTRNYQIAINTYQGMKRYSGEEYVTHTLNVAIMLAQLSAPENVIYAGLFCDALTKGTLSKEELKQLLPKNVFSIVEKLDVPVTELENTEEEVALIKLAERLHNMRTIEYVNLDLKREKAKETIEIVLPFARKIKQNKLIEELNDLAMRYYC